MKCRSGPASAPAALGNEDMRAEAYTNNEKAEAQTSSGDRR
jgi:hypothetical protein